MPKYVYATTFQRKGEMVDVDSEIFPTKEEAEAAVQQMWKRHPHKFSDGQPSYGRHVILLMVWDSLAEWENDER